MKQKAKLYKSNLPMLSTGVRGHGLINFFNGRFATSNPALIKAIDEQVVGDPVLQVYVDPKEPEVDLSEALSTVGIPDAELRKYIYDTQMAQYLKEESTSVQSGVGAVHSKSSPLTGGPSGTQRFTAAELAAATSGAKVVQPASAPAAAVTKPV